ncbi:MAG: precorrin-2 C(20)-methyltransferase [Clostridiales bacterium]|nr:precorrin-2 C(20)-methyltransferase [Clostridiales bacterium]
MSGTLYGVGVGPGNPEDLTIRALNTIKKCDLVAIPTKDKEQSHAYRIIKQAWPEIDKKEVLCLPFPMIKDKETLEAHYEELLLQVLDLLDKGKNVAFLTIGDPTVYSTYLALHKRIRREGHPAQIVSGIPSFCAVAATLQIGLSEKEQEVHIIPASYQGEDALSYSGTKIFMKSGRTLKGFIENLEKWEKNHPCEIYAVSNCGMQDEVCYDGVEELVKNKEMMPYLTTVIVKEGNKER